VGTAYNWKREQTRLWQTLVPKSGRASTLQGELIRITGKLTDEAYRNGNMNWMTTVRQCGDSSATI